ncbi:MULTISPECIES: hypothetical protein [unclassified Mesorhizobium]|uniref:hypothetical protein n=1 Tax=unclassified Mesorhizobium TaxID=325217 RepID=UPI000FD9B83A|nr:MULTISPECIES: hypothetical protein [unclassified Mesorhizobium]TGR23343.1 hypothetical protein EN845_20285 [Mesorhizobium sp. M8A.F.Ca.ET.202.01.1.1]TGR24576.1 hypothetical protein EN840_18930 [Mesorhizobium sp. M8A.F.Ca.ET.197.01.1.1]TGR39966.1 hypothetical protein EN842_38965 [bacterium M00.F.Ca.ET.199.01.1.1]TGV89386.1 hypothetical protein EN792_004225 [Mesorhizobium sp. M00.F.Ca.ET.149.01.1.1]
MKITSKFPRVDGSDRLRAHLEKEEEEAPRCEPANLVPIIIHGYIDSVIGDDGVATGMSIMVTKVEADWEAEPSSWEVELSCGSETNH